MPVTLIEARISSSSPDSSGASGGPRQQWLDVTFPNAPVMLSYVCFHNFYTSAITISHTTVRTDDSGRSPHWQVVLPKLTLMADPHCEDDAQRYHELMHSSHFAADFDHRRVTRLRICCLQPSPLWREYGLRNLRFYSIDVPLAPSLQPPPSLTQAEREQASSVVELLLDMGSIASQIRSTIAGGVAASSTTRQATRSVFDGSVNGLPTAAGGGDVGGASGSGASGRRSESSLSPYILGEWADEWTLKTVDGMIGPPAPARPGTASPSALGSGVGSRALRPQSAYATTSPSRG